MACNQVLAAERYVSGVCTLRVLYIDGGTLAKPRAKLGCVLEKTERPDRAKPLDQINYNRVHAPLWNQRMVGVILIESQSNHNSVTPDDSVLYADSISLKSPADS